MLRIDLLESDRLRMSGRLAEGCRAEVETFVGSHETVPNTVVDLSEVTYIIGPEKKSFAGSVYAE